MEYIKFLGSSGAKTATEGVLSILIDENSVIDAGNIINGLSNRAYLVNNIFLTHAHLDHISDLPFLIEERAVRASRPLKIYATKETIKILKHSIFNGKIWPDFTKITLQKSRKKVIKFIEVKPFEKLDFRHFSIEAIPTNHTKGSCGYLVKSANSGILITADTYICKNIWERLNKDNSIHSLCIDLSFPSRFSKLAKLSKHLTPKLLKRELKNLKREVAIYPIHLKPIFYKEIEKEIEEYKILRNGSWIVGDGDLIYFDKSKKSVRSYEIRGRFDKVSKKIYDLAIALSNQKDVNKFLKMVLDSAREITNADGGTIYMLNEQTKALEFVVVQNGTMGIDIGANESLIDWKPLVLFREDGKPNRDMVAVVSVLDNRIINIDDVYSMEEFDFCGTKEFDKRSGYRSKSMLVIPLFNHEDRVIGVLQLINKLDYYSNIVSFDSYDEKIIQTLASICATAITKERLLEDMEILFESFLKTINVAIEKKSEHTAGHISRVVEITMMITKAINEDKTFFKDKHYSFDELQEMKFSALMHDIGKIGIPEHILSKATKLQALLDGVEMIELKAEIRKKELLISQLKNILESMGEKFKPSREYQESLESIDRDLEFIRWANMGREYFGKENLEKIKKIAKHQIRLNERDINWLSDDELALLSIERGTLSPEEKEMINSHAKIGSEILDSLPFPKKYSKVPEIASSHHEKLDGSGYPKGLRDKEISFEARILAIADIFEALTASDRPYKRANLLSETMKILFQMAREGAIDIDIVKFLYSSGLYLKIAKRLLPEDSIDEVNIDLSAF